MSEDAGIKLLPDEVAASAYRCFECGMGRTPAEWDGLSFEAQTPWLLVAKRAEGILNASEGRRFAEVGQLLRAAAGLTDDNAHTKLAWEALAHHLHALADQFEITDLPELERYAAAWVAQHLEMV